ncbi:39S ribosomal protein L1, mitochondrial [Ornithorhynchus anatinus]|uniref:39S ribosomal protein L1, mitochondrial n=1 Tax=Ornithorhynchus anatinus TaxID=9258 RepID=UPI0010A82C04|nr:39S ribosomal protein L1, mitochondrial [Ornithorhynchus anatinus]
MAAGARGWRAVVTRFQSLGFSRVAHRPALASRIVNIKVPIRQYAAAAKSKSKQKPQEKSSGKKKDAPPKQKVYPFMEGEPEDDVYLKHLYPRQIYEAEKAIHLLKKFQVLDFTYPKQMVYLDLTLEMTPGKKKKKAEPFSSVLNFPYPFTSEVNKVLVFSEKAEDIKVAEDNGAAFAGGTELIQKILDDEIQADFYVAVPEIVLKLNLLRRKLKNRFPKKTRNSIGRDIPKMLELYKTGHEIAVKEERENFLQTRIATLDMPTEQIVANLQAVLTDVGRHKQENVGPFVARAFLRSATSEGLLLKVDRRPPRGEEEEEAAEEDDER